MRARFSAYALGDAPYILRTTDPEGPQHEADLQAWAAQVLSFCQSTRFEGLKIVSGWAGGSEGQVHFEATLTQGERDASSAEVSRFTKGSQGWLYHSGRPPA